MGPPAPVLLTHIIKAKGLPLSIRYHKDEGHIIICIICLLVLTKAPLLIHASSLSVVGDFDS